MKNYKMRLFLVRHGQSEGNIDKSKYFEKDDCDIELTEKGKKDAIDAADKITELIKHITKPDLDVYDKPNAYFQLFHSTYKRATQTANIIYDRINDTEKCFVESLIPSPLCIEREWGSLRDIVESRMKTEHHFNFYYRPTNGESFCDAYNRSALFHQWMVNNTVYENNIIVAHGEFNKVYLMHLLNWDVKEFNKWGNLKNGEVWMIENGELSTLTPLRPSKYI